MASFDEIASYAKSKGGRLPTEAELRFWMDSLEGGDRVDCEGSNVGFKNWHPVASVLTPPRSLALCADCDLLL